MITPKKTGFKQLLCLLLTVVMLAGFVPLSAVTAGAETETYPTRVGNFYGKEMGYYKIEKGELKSYTVPATDFVATDSEQKWSNFKRAYAANKDIVGFIYYADKEGKVYINGSVDTIAFRTSTVDSDSLTVIVDGDTTVKDPIYGYKGQEYTGLEKMTFLFRNNATLTLTGKKYNNETPEKAAILDITHTKTEGNNSEPLNYGDLELRGTGKLKIIAPDYSENSFAIRAYGVSVLENVSLDIQMGSKYFILENRVSSAITCYGMNINTTGTVTVDTSQKLDPHSRDNRGYFAGLSIMDKSLFKLNLTKAKKFTLKVREMYHEFLDEKGVGLYYMVFSEIKNDLATKGWVLTETKPGEFPRVCTFTNKNNRPAPDVVESYVANAGMNATALKQGQAKFTWVQIYSDRDKLSGGPYNEMTATMKCEVVDENIAGRIGYNSGNPSVTSESQLSDLKIKLKSSDMYYRPTGKTLTFPNFSKDIYPDATGKGTFRYLLSVEAYFNDTYYYDGAGVAVSETSGGSIGKKGATDNHLTVTPRGMVFQPNTDSGLGDPPTELKIVVDTQIGREFSNTNNAPGGYYVKNYPDMYVSNLRVMNMPNTNLELELKRGTVLSMGRYVHSRAKSDIAANICADNLIVRGAGVLLASDYDNVFLTAGKCGAAISANTVNINSSGIIIDLYRYGDNDCIQVPTPSAFKPVNAKSVTMSVKDGCWVSGVDVNEAAMQEHCGYSWDIFYTSFDAVKTVEFGRSAATLSDPVLHLGGNEYEKYAIIPDYVPEGGKGSFSVSFTAGPRWYKMLCVENQIKSNAIIEVWKDGEYQGKLTVNEQYNYSYDGVVEYNFSVPSLKLEAGHVYKIYGFMNPYNGSNNLAKSKAASWSFYVSDGNVNNTIPAVSLYQRNDLRPDQSVSANDIKWPASANYEISSQTEWYGAVDGDGRLISGNEYTKTVTLTAKGNYRFSQFCDVTIDNQNSEIAHYDRSTDRKTMTVYLSSTAVRVIETASGTLNGFYLGMRTDAAYVVSDEPDKYDIGIYYVAERLSDELDDAEIFEKTGAYVFGLEVYPKAGYAFKNGAAGTVKLVINADRDDGGLHTAATSYKTGVYVGSNYYSGNLYETIIARGAPAQAFDRLDIILPNPVAGKSAADATDVTVAQKTFGVAKVEWEKERGGLFTEAFTAGETYVCNFWIECPWYTEPGNNYTVYVNGEEAYNVYVDTVKKPGTILIAVNQPMTAVDEISEGVTVSGGVQSYGNDTDETVIWLIAENTSEAAYEAVITGNNADYRFDGVAAGTYTARIMKKNHAAAEYSVVVDKDDVTLDINLWLYGDVDKSGEIMASDALAALKASVGKLTLSDMQSVLADVDANGSVSANDALIILQASVGKLQIDDFPIAKKSAA